MVQFEVGSRGCVHEGTPALLLGGARHWRLCAFKKQQGSCRSQGSQWGVVVGGNGALGSSHTVLNSVHPTDILHRSDPVAEGRLGDWSLSSGPGLNRRRQGRCWARLLGAMASVEVMTEDLRHACAGVGGVGTTLGVL